MVATNLNRAIRLCEVSSIPFECPNCHTHVGDFVPDNGAVKLDAGGWLIGDGKRHCHRCGRLVHFKAPRETWSELVRRYLERSGISLIVEQS